MARPISDPTLARCEFLLGAETRRALDAIAREFGRRTNRPATRTDAVRWAALELAARLELDRGAALTKTPINAPAGPVTRPPGAPSF